MSLIVILLYNNVNYMLLWPTKDLTKLVKKFICALVDLNKIRSLINLNGWMKFYKTRYEYNLLRA